MGIEVCTGGLDWVQFLQFTEERMTMRRAITKIAVCSAGSGVVQVQWRGEKEPGETHVPAEGRVVSVTIRPRFLASRSAFTRFTVAVVTCSRIPCTPPAP